MPDRSHIFDGFEEGDLPRMFNDKNIMTGLILARAIKR
jgi:hypothetical protein